MKHLIIGILMSLIGIAYAAPPNVIIIIADDQGYGDFSAHGNPVLKTPHMDQFRKSAVRFTDFHVAPMCSPTRGQLMTGIDAMRNGCTAVCQGRSMMRAELSEQKDLSQKKPEMPAEEELVNDRNGLLMKKGGLEREETKMIPTRLPIAHSEISPTTDASKCPNS